MKQMFWMKKPKTALIISLFLLMFSLLGAQTASGTVYAASADTLSSKDKEEGYKDVCGRGNRAVKVKFNFGCLGNAGPANKGFGPIQDLAYSIIRFLSVGVGIVIVLSIIVAGIQYSSSAGVPETTGKAKNRIQHTIIGLFIYIFTFAILQYLIPGGVFRPGEWINPDSIFRLVIW